MSNTDTLRNIIASSEKLASVFAPQDDQKKITIYKNTYLLVYHVDILVDKETYFLHNVESFFSTEPILPKEHLRMQQLMVREKRTRCIFYASFQDIGDEPEIITVERDQLLHDFLNSE